MLRTSILAEFGLDLLLSGHGVHRLQDWLTCRGFVVACYATLTFE